MSSQPTDDDQDKFQQECPGAPSPGVRTVISLLLFVHLFALGAAIAGNFGAQSGLRRKLHEDVPLIRPYLRILNMDRSFANESTMIYNTSEDFDHFVDILLNTPLSFGNTREEIAKLEKIDLMPTDAWPGVRRHRYWMLAMNLAMLEPDEARGSVLPQALASGMLRAHNIKEGTHRFRCRAQQAMSMSDYRAEDPALRDPNNPNYFFSAYEASLTESGGKWNLIKQESRGEMTQGRRVQSSN